MVATLLAAGKTGVFAKRVEQRGADIEGETVRPIIDRYVDANRLARIPGVIVQGRYDIVCPTISADDLHRAWPAAEYVVVHDAGHSAFEPGIRSRLVLATEEFKKRL